LLQDNFLWVNDLPQGVSNFLELLNKNNSNFEYDFSTQGVTKQGEKLKLGFSCFALKLNYIIQSNLFTKKDYENWVKYINSFQVSNSNFPVNSYIDENYLKYAKEFSLSKVTKNLLKSSVNLLLPNRYELLNVRIQNAIKAESKQAISTIHQMGFTNCYSYSEFPNTEKKIRTYLDNLNWTYPWHAGAQFSALCLFVSTQMTDEENMYKAKNFLKTFSTDLVDKETGFYFRGKQNNKQELINGAMKMITGFSWLDTQIHYPEKIIDFCLNEKVSNEGCDIVDIVYVLFECSKQTDYRKGDIHKFLVSLIPVIHKHYYQDIGGFSYFLNQSQTHYYGVNVTTGQDAPDLHGTILLVWAISLILKVINYDYVDFNILKP